MEEAYPQEDPKGEIVTCDERENRMLKLAHGG
jgi:hypothetical protein